MSQKKNKNKLRYSLDIIKSSHRTAGPYRWPSCEASGCLCQPHIAGREGCESMSKKKSFRTSFPREAPSDDPKPDHGSRQRGPTPDACLMGRSKGEECRGSWWHGCARCHVHAGHAVTVTRVQQTRPAAGPAVGADPLPSRLDQAAAHTD